MGIQRGQYDGGFLARIADGRRRRPLWCDCDLASPRA